MTVYTVEEAGKKLAMLLSEAIADGEVRIRDDSGRMFALKPTANRSPLDVEGVDVDISQEEIVAIVRESRER